MRSVVLLTMAFACSVGPHRGASPDAALDSAADAGPTCADFDFIEQAPLPVQNGIANVIAGDLNGDGAPDVYARSFPGGVINGHGASDMILLNDQHGTLTGMPPDHLTTRYDCQQLRIVDIDRDGHADVLCVTNPSYPAIQAMLGTGTSAWRVRDEQDFTDHSPTSAAVWPALPAGTVVYADSRMGVQVSQLQDASGTLGSGASLVGSGSFDSVAVSDVDRDGEDDLLAHDGSADTLTIFAGSDGSSRTFTDTQGQIDVADIDGDGTKDVVGFGDRIEVQRIVNGQPASGTFTDLPGAGPFLSRFLVDANVDSHVDIVLVSPTQVFLLLGTGDGSFAPARELTHSGAPLALQFSSSPALVDLDNDGKLDLVTGAEDSLRVFRGCGVH